MRRLRCTLPLVALTLIGSVMLVGCKNQPNSLTNPFLTPDRVPPPSTRVLTPGTAQLYYPGDPLPGTSGFGGQAPAFTPAQPTSPSSAWNNYPQSAPPATTPYSPTTSYGVQPSSATSEWPVQGQIVPPGATEIIRVPEDESRLRFAGAESYQQLAAPNAIQGAPTSNAVAAVQPQMPIQSILPTQADPRAFAADAVLQASAEQAPPQRVEIRAIRAAANLEPAEPQAISQDGFRPQGSTRRRGEIDDTIRPQFDADHSSIAPLKHPSFGMGGQYEWLRGQLERSPTTGDWRIRYQRADEQPDQLGGSVIVANPQVLGNLQAGDFVMVRGQLHNLHYVSGSTVPAYQLAVVQRQVR